jgi:hypothetical protein
LEKVKTWNGGKNSAIFQAGSYPLNADNSEPVTLAENVYKRMVTELVDLASPHDVETARKLLESTVLALAYSLGKRAHLADGIEDPATSEALAALRAAPFVMEGSGVIVPKSLDKFDRIGLVHFADHEGCTTGRPAPDPMLLAIKSAINWSWRNGQQMLATGERPEEEDELDTIEEEEYLAYQREAWEALPVEVAFRLQPDGAPGSGIAAI